MQEWGGGPEPYAMVNTGSMPGGGMMGLPMPGLPVCWTMYVAVEGLDAFYAKLKELGAARIMKERIEVLEIG